MKQKRKMMMAIGAVGAFQASVLLMNSNPYIYLLAFSGLCASAAIALMLMEWTRT